jgi:hypothetical protein
MPSAFRISTYNSRRAGADWDGVVFRRIFVLDVDAFGKIYFDKTLPKYGDGPETMDELTSCATGRQ